MRVQSVARSLLFLGLVLSFPAHAEALRIPLDLFTLPGSGWSQDEVREQLAQLNQVFAQCDVVFEPELMEELQANDLGLASPPDRICVGDHATCEPLGISVTTEDIAAKTHRSPRRTTVYFTKDLQRIVDFGSGPELAAGRGVAYRQRDPAAKPTGILYTAWVDRTIASIPALNAYVLSHEVAHILVNETNADTPTANLLNHERASLDLTSDQCSAIRSPSNLFERLYK
jgi:hypothetical protein